MDGVYRSLLTICLILGVHIHLPVTMFPASDVMAENRPIFDDKQENLSKNPDILRWSRNKVNKAIHQGHDRIIKNYDSIIGSDYKGLNGINRNQFHSKDLMGFRESDPVNYEKINTHLSAKNDFILEKLKQTKEKLTNISNIFIKNSNDLGLQKEHGQSHIKEVINTESHNHRLTEGTTWSAEIVKKCPKPFSSNALNSLIQTVQNSEIIKIEEGCGGMQNRLVTFNDSTKACVRYRYNVDLMQGEIYSFYLSKLLNIENTAPTVLHKIENNKLWSKVWSDVLQAKWSESRPVILTKWIENLEPVFMPHELKGIDKKIDGNTSLFTGKTLTELCDLVQWGDLIIFDYMSANPDRVVNNLFNLKWNDRMMNKPIHNLEKSADNGAFVFLDNESGLFHGYRLLDSHDHYHKQLLNSICIFSPETVKTVEKLYKDGNIGDKLIEAFVSGERYQNLLPRISTKNLKILQKRLEDVYRHVQSCKHQPKHTTAY